MKHLSARRSRVAAFTSAAAMSAVFAVPGIASGAVTSTAVTSPSPDSVFDSKTTMFFGGGVEDTSRIRVTGVAPGAADGDEVYIVCTIVGNGAIDAFPLSYEPVAVENGAFAADVFTPPYTCRVRAVPADVVEEDATESTLAPFAGPRVLGGGFSVLDYGEAFDDAEFDGVESYFSTRGQRNGITFSFGAASPYGIGGIGGAEGSGGIYLTALLEDTYYRFLFGPSALLGGFGAFGGGPSGGELLSEAGLIVDDKPAVAAPYAGTQKAKIVSRTLDRTDGDQVVVESLPLGFPVDDAEPGTPSFLPTGVVLERTTTSDRDGQQVRVNDVFRSIDGAAHRMEARYGESVYQDVFGEYEDETLVEPASFRIPWQTGDEYVVPAAGRTFGPAPAGPTTIWIHGPRQDFSRIGEGTRAARSTAGGTETDAARGARAVARADDGGLPRRAEGALTFDAAPTDGRFLSKGSLVVRFVREIPAGGTTSIATTLSQDLTPEGLKDLVEGPAAPQPNPSAPLPAATPLPTQPAVFPRLPVPGAPNPLPKLARSTGKVLISKAQGRRLRDRKPVTVTTKAMPAGRYGVTIRRWVKDGRTIANGVKTIRKDGDLKVALRLTKYGRWYLGLKKTRDRRSVRVRVIVTWTPPGKGRLKQKTTYTTNFR